MATTFVDRETVITAAWLNAADAVVTNAFILELSAITDTASRNAYFTAAISAFTATASGAVPASGGGTENFLRADGSWAAPAIPPTVNFVINGGMAVARRAEATLSASQQYGSVDRMRVAATGGTPSAGTIKQATAANVGRSGYALRLDQATISGSGVVTLETHIEARDAVKLKNVTASIGILCWHNIGSAKVAAITVDKATAANDFSSVTNIGTSSSTSVPSGTATPVLYEGITMGDCSNGVRIQVAITVGAITTKDFEFAELIISEGATVQDFTHLPYVDEAGRCARYFRKTFADSVAPAQNAGYDGALTYAAQLADTAPYIVHWPFDPQMKSDPTVTFYNPRAANTKWANKTQGADSGTAAEAWSGSFGSGVPVKNPQASGDAPGDILSIHATADADFSY